MCRMNLVFSMVIQFFYAGVGGRIVNPENLAGILTASNYLDQPFGQLKQGWCNSFLTKKYIFHDRVPQSILNYMIWN